jgi:hypothetical protein
MLRFQWDSLRRGDHILVHDSAQQDLDLRPAVVVLVDASRRGHRLAVRYTDGPDRGHVVRPGRFATHFDPISDETACWRCEDLALTA